MMAKSKCRQATNYIFSNVVVSLLTTKNIGFHNSVYVILYPQPRPTTDGYPSFTGYPG